MDSRDLAIDIVRKLTAAGFTAYWAGGCVRDLLMGRNPDDYDVASNATPEQVRQIFGKNRTLAVGQSFGVIIVLGPRGSGLQVEVATFRTEGEYRDGRRPEAVSFSTPEKDAQRRDFTINGMFYDPLTEAVHDFVGGEQDLNRRVLRAIGDARARMSEDKLRMLRAVRFSALLDFELDPQTTLAVADMASQIVLVSAERIAQELRKMLAHPRRGYALRLLREVNLLPVILPEVEEYIHDQGEESWPFLLALQEALQIASFEESMAALHLGIPSIPEKRGDPELHHGSVQAACHRLKLSNDELDHIVWLVENRGQVSQIPAMSLADRKRLCVEPHLKDLLHLERARRTLTGESLEPIKSLQRYLKETPPEVMNPTELLTGRDLISLGHTPGPQFKEWLHAIRTAQLNEEISSRSEALDLLGEMVQQSNL